MSTNVSSAKIITAFDRLLTGVVAKVDPWVLEHESPEVLDLLLRFARSQLSEPLPPLQSVNVYYDVYWQEPFTIAFHCQASEISYDEWSQWNRVLSRREAKFAAKLTPRDRDLLTHRIQSIYDSDAPRMIDAEPSWFQEAKYWPELSR